MDNPTKRLYEVVEEETGKEGKRFLSLAFNYLYPPYKMELDSAPPADETECSKLVAKWLERLKNAGSALQHFPTLRPGRGTWAPGGTIAAERSPVEGFEDGGLLHKRDPVGPDLCRQRDKGICVLTGRKSSDGWAVEVAHIIPWAFTADASRRNLLLWHLIELFLGVEQTNLTFAGLASTIDSLWNLVSLDKSLHSLYDNGHLVLVPVTTQGDPIPISSTYSGTYLLQIRFPKSLSDPDLVTSSKIVGSDRTQTLHDGSYIALTYDPDAPINLQRLPSPSYFAFRAWLQWLKFELSGRANWQVNLGRELWA